MYYRVDGKLGSCWQMLGVYDSYESALSASVEKGSRLSCETRVVEDRAGKRKSNRLDKLVKQSKGR